jgi:hypothetical protein
MPDLPKEQAPDEGELAAQRSQPRYPPLLSAGSTVSGTDADDVRYLDAKAPPAAPDGFETVTTIYNASKPGAADGELITVYTADRLAEGDTFLDVIGAGGAIFIQRPTIGNDAALVKETIGDAATLVPLGDLTAAVAESTTRPGNLRSYGMYWSDGKLDYSIESGGGFEEVVRLGQSLYCG